MSLLDAFRSPVTEGPRLDRVVREHDQLERRFNTLVELLMEKKVLTRDEVARLRTDTSNEPG